MYINLKWALHKSAGDRIPFQVAKHTSVGFKTFLKWQNHPKKDAIFYECPDEIDYPYSFSKISILLKVSKSPKKKYGALDPSKKRMMGQSYVLRIAPAFVFWKNPGRHDLLLRLADL